MVYSDISKARREKRNSRQLPDNCSDCFPYELWLRDKSMIAFRCGCSSLQGMTQMVGAQRMIFHSATRKAHGALWCFPLLFNNQNQGKKQPNSTKAPCDVCATG